MSDKLDQVFEKQINFQILLDKDLGKLLKKINGYNDLHIKQSITKNTILQLFSESNEILNEINWKDHKDGFEIDKNKIKEEIIDAFHFVINLALIWGMNSEEFYNEFMKKNNKNFERFVK